MELEFNFNVARVIHRKRLFQPSHRSRGITILHYMTSKHNIRLDRRNLTGQQIRCYNIIDFLHSIGAGTRQTTRRKNGFRWR